LWCRGFEGRKGGEKALRGNVFGSGVSGQIEMREAFFLKQQIKIIQTVDNRYGPNASKITGLLVKRTAREIAS
jgi:hypothetical protein